MLTTILGLVIVTLLGVGIRVLAMQTIQQRRERMNRQINEITTQASPVITSIPAGDFQ